jgi:IS5 family transposase
MGPKTPVPEQDFFQHPLREQINLKHPLDAGINEDAGR